jgi:hypothetical protein
LEAEKEHKMYRVILWGVLAAWPCVVAGATPTDGRQNEGALAVTQDLASKAGDALPELSWTKQTVALYFLHTVPANAGYAMTSALVDGAAVGIVSSNAFSSVAANQTSSATFAQKNTQKNVYSWIQQTDETHTKPYWEYRTVLSQRYPFLKPFKLVYLNNPDIDTQPDNFSYLQLDLDRVRKILSDTTAIPAGTYIALDLEGKKWSMYSNEIARPKPGWINTNIIAAKTGIIKAIKAMRPDCYFSFYNFPETNGIAATLHWSVDNMGQPTTEESLDELEAAAKPVIDASDYIAPDLYWFNRQWKASDVTVWVKKAIDRTRKLYPDKKIIPFTSWVLWEHITGDMRSQSYQWTPAVIELVTVSGPNWKQFLNALSDAGINDIILYNDGTWMPWDPQAPWWLQMCDWAGAPRKSRF